MTQQMHNEAVNILNRLSQLEGRTIQATDANVSAIHNLRFELATEFEVPSWDLIAGYAGNLGVDTQRLQVSLSAGCR